MMARQSDTVIFSIINDEWPVNKEKLIAIDHRKRK